MIDKVFEEAMIAKMFGRFLQTQNGWISKTTWKLCLLEGNLDLFEASMDTLDGVPLFCMFLPATLKIMYYVL